MMIQTKFGSIRLVISEEKIFENVYDGRTDGRTDDGRQVMAKAHLAFELKRVEFVLNFHLL
jgi:hypothetical protein